MIKKDLRIEAYIKKSAKFAQPILIHLRKIIHASCQDVEETIKWGFPHFEYKGILCSIGAYKKHCLLVFWKGKIMKDPHNLLAVIGKTSMAQIGNINDISDLPGDKILLAYLKEAVKLNDDDVKVLIPERDKVKNDLSPT